MAEDIQIKVEGDSSVFSATVCDSNDSQIRSAPPGSVVTVPFSFNSEPYVKIEKVGSKDITGVEVGGTINEDYGYVTELEFTRKTPWMGDPFWKGVLSSKVEGTYRGHVITIKPQYAGAGGPPTFSFDLPAGNYSADVYEDGTLSDSLTPGNMETVELSDTATQTLRLTPDAGYVMDGVTVSSTGTDPGTLTFSEDASGGYWEAELTAATQGDYDGEDITVAPDVYETPEDLSVTLAGDTDKVRFEVWRDGSKHADFTGGVLDWVEGVSIQLRAYAEPTYSISGITGLDFTDAGDYCYCDITPAVEQANRGETIALDVSTSNTSLDVIKVKINGDEERFTAKLYNSNDDSYYSTLPINVETEVPFSFSQTYYVQLEAQGYEEITGVDVSDNAYDIANQEKLTFTYNEGLNFKTWDADFTANVEQTYRGRVIGITPQVISNDPPITFLFEADDEKSYAELHFENSKQSDIPYNSEINIPYDSEIVKNIVVRPASGMEIIAIEVSGEMDSSVNGKMEFYYDEAGGDFWFTQITGQNATYYGSNLVTVRILSVLETNKIAPFNKIHLIGDAETTQLSNVALEPILGFEGKFADRSVYIINLLYLPFKIPEYLISVETQVKFGSYESGIVAPIIRSDSIGVDLGEITVPDVDLSSLDYDANTFELVLPFVENTVSLQPSHVYGKTVRAEYIVDAYNGDMTINVYNGGNQPIATQTGSVGRSIPIKTLTDSVGSLGAESGASNQVFTAFIRETKTETLESQYTNLVLKSGALGDASGYVEVENVDLNFSATSQEKADIEGWLTTGVMMK